MERPTSPGSACSSSRKGERAASSHRIPKKKTTRHHLSWRRSQRDASRRTRTPTTRETAAGADKPNKKYYDPRMPLRAAEEATVERLGKAMEDLKCVNVL